MLSNVATAYYQITRSWWGRYPCPPAHSIWHRQNPFRRLYRNMGSIKFFVSQSAVWHTSVHAYLRSAQSQPTLVVYCFRRSLTSLNTCIFLSYPNINVCVIRWNFSFETLSWKKQNALEEFVICSLTRLKIMKRQIFSEYYLLYNWNTRTHTHRQYNRSLFEICNRISGYRLLKSQFPERRTYLNIIVSSPSFSNYNIFTLNS